MPLRRHLQQQLKLERQRRKLLGYKLFLIKRQPRLKRQELPTKRRNKRDWMLRQRRLD